MRDRSAKTRWPPWLPVLALALAMGLAFQGARHLWEPDEGRYTTVAQLMLETGDWLTPRLDEERPHFTKPPLTYWAIAASVAVFGSDEWALRLPNAIAFAATALLVFGIARRTAPAAAAHAAAVWITLAGPALAANVITPDTLLALWETLSVYGFVAAGLVGGSDAAPAPGRGGLATMWLGFALAFATKGPPGLLPLAAMVAWLGWQGRWRDVTRLCYPAGIALFAAVGLGWYVAMVARDPGLLRYFLGRELLERIATGDFRRNGDMWGWLDAYGPMLAIGLLPWLAIWPIARWRRSPDATAAWSWPPAFAGFLRWWILLPLVVLCLSRSRLPLYVLPLFVPLALWLAGRIAATGVRWATAPSLVLCAGVAVIGVKLFGATQHPPTDSHRLAEDLRPFLSPGRYTAIGFVDTVPAYGLRHYTGLPVRHLDLPGHPHPSLGYVPPPGLCEGSLPAERVLFLTPEHDVAAASAMARQCGWPGLRRLGTAGRFVVLERG